MGLKKDISFLEGSLNVLAHGAKNDNATDNTAVFKSVFEKALNTGRPAYIPAGDYFISSTISLNESYKNNDLTIIGNSARLIISAAAGNNNGIIYSNRASLTDYSTNLSVGSGSLKSGDNIISIKKNADIKVGSEIFIRLVNSASQGDVLWEQLLTVNKILDDGSYRVNRIKYYYPENEETLPDGTVVKTTVNVINDFLNLKVSGLKLHTVLDTAATSSNNTVAWFNWNAGSVHMDNLSHTTDREPYDSEILGMYYFPKILQSNKTVLNKITNCEVKNTGYTFWFIQSEDNLLENITSINNRHLFTSSTARKSTIKNVTCYGGSVSDSHGSDDLKFINCQSYDARDKENARTVGTLEVINCNFGGTFNAGSASSFRWFGYVNETNKHWYIEKFSSKNHFLIENSTIESDLNFSSGLYISTGSNYWNKKYDNIKIKNSRFGSIANFEPNSILASEKIIMHCENVMIGNSSSIGITQHVLDKSRGASNTCLDNPLNIAKFYFEGSGSSPTGFDTYHIFLNGRDMNNNYPSAPFRFSLPSIPVQQSASVGKTITLGFHYAKSNSRPGTGWDTVGVNIFLDLYGQINHANSFNGLNYLFKDSAMLSGLISNTVVSNFSYSAGTYQPVSISNARSTNQGNTVLNLPYELSGVGENLAAIETDISLTINQTNPSIGLNFVGQLIWPPDNS